MKLLSLMLMLLLSFSLLEAKGNNQEKGFNKSGKSYKNSHKNNKKMKKSKGLSKGLQKKYERTGELPAGWQKKIKVGSFVSPDVLSKAKVVEPKKVNNTQESSYSTIYKIEDKVIRINNATKAILEVFK